MGRFPWKPATIVAAVLGVSAALFAPAVSSAGTRFVASGYDRAFYEPWNDAATVPYLRNTGVHFAPKLGVAQPPARRPETIFHEDDLSYFGGAVLKSVKSIDILVNTTDLAVGSPSVFLTHFGSSSMITLLDQYLGVKGPFTHTYLESIAYPCAACKPGFAHALVDLNVEAIVNAVATKTGLAGYGYEYHVFLPKGYDECFAVGQGCYSPDSPNSWAFCAYHSSFDNTKTKKHYIYSVMPYQDIAVKNVGACTVATSKADPSPNGALIDSTASTLSHEYSESITDPDPPTGWVNGRTGNEIGDECAYIPDLVALGGKNYDIQPEYSNKYHACANQP